LPAVADACAIAAALVTLPRASRARSVVLLLLSLNGCATRWQVQDVPPTTLLRTSGASDFLVTTTGGRQYELRDPVIDRDSLVGVEKADPTGPDVRVRRAIALADVKQVAVREADGVASAFWIALGGLFVVYLGLAALMSGMGGPSS